MSVSSIADSGMRIEEDADSVWVMFGEYKLQVASESMERDGMVYVSIWRGSVEEEPIAGMLVDLKEDRVGVEGPPTWPVDIERLFGLK